MVGKGEGRRRVNSDPGLFMVWYSMFRTEKHGLFGPGLLLMPSPEGGEEGGGLLLYNLEKKVIKPLIWWENVNSKKDIYFEASGEEKLAFIKRDLGERVWHSVKIIAASQV